MRIEKKYTFVYQKCSFHEKSDTVIYFREKKYY
jgi:hypothetical protein